MSDTVRKVNYFSTSVANKPGQTFGVLAALVSGGVNLLACSGSTSGKKARIDVVPDDTRKFAAVAKKAGITFSPKKAGFLIQGGDSARRTGGQPEGTGSGENQRRSRRRSFRGKRPLGRDRLGGGSRRARAGTVLRANAK